MGRLKNKHMYRETLHSSVSVTLMTQQKQSKWLQNSVTRSFHTILINMAAKLNSELGPFEVPKLKWKKSK